MPGLLGLAALGLAVLTPAIDRAVPDLAENVVEYIARHTLDDRAPSPFGVKDILYASEIAFIVDDVPAMASKVKETHGLGQYSRAGEGFHAIGDACCSCSAAAAS